MTGISTVLAWRPDDLDQVADGLVARRRTLVDLQDELDAGRPPATWGTGAATLARTTHEGLQHRIADLVAEVSAVATALDTGRTSLAVARSQLVDALDHARSQRFSVDTATGRVTDTACYADEDVVADRQAACNEVADRIEQALRNAVHAVRRCGERHGRRRTRPAPSSEGRRRR